VLLVGALSSALGTIRTIRNGVFPYTLGTFSIKESVSLYFGYDLVLKRVFPCTLDTFSVNECLLVLWAHLVSRERVLLVLWVQFV
jgi:hypothetical protein